MTIFWIIAAILCAVYGFLVFRIGSGTTFFMIWILLSLVCVFFAWAAKVHLWSRLSKGSKVVFLVLTILCLSLFAFVEALICSGFKQNEVPDLDYLIVLGAQVKESGPSTILRFRLDEACEYLADNPDTICILSGGQGRNEPFPEAVGMKTYLLDKGIPESQLLLEDRSLSTRENIEFSKQLFESENPTVGIVTNNFHVFRACAIAQKSGIRNVTGLPAYSAPFYLPNNMLREFLGVIKDYCVGNI